MTKQIAEIDALFEKQLVRYQKVAFSLLYPALLSMFSSIIGFFADDFSYSLAFAGTKTLSVWLLANPVLGSLAWSRAIIVFVGFFLTVLFVFLAIMAVKAHIFGFIVAIALYLADSVYACFAYSGDLFSFLATLGVHIVFLAIFAYLVVTYAKLWRLEGKLRAESKNDRQPKP